MPPEGNYGVPTEYTTHTIRLGETWNGIAAQYQTTREVLWVYNQITPADLIWAGPWGKELKIPIAPQGTSLGVKRDNFTEFVIYQVNTPTQEEPEQAEQPDRIVPQPYLIRTEDDLFRWMWVHQWHLDIAQYNQSEAEKRFREFVALAVTDFQSELHKQETEWQKLTSNHLINETVTQLMSYGINYGAAQQFASALSIDQLLAVYDQLSKTAGSDNVVDLAFPEYEEYITYYQNIQTLEQGGSLSSDPYAGYDDSLAISDYYKRLYLEDEFYDEEKIREHLRENLFELTIDLLYEMQLEQGAAYAPGAGTNTAPMDRATVAQALIRELGEDFTYEDLVAYAQRLAQERQAAGGAIVDPDTFIIHTPGDSQAILAYTTGYYEAEAFDNLRKIVYDPTWNPAEEARLLTELDTAIGQVVREIMGVDIGFVQDGLRAFYITSRQAHDWRMKLKAEVDRIELEMLEREGAERQSLWWVVEIGLGILFEPLDWLFTARDLLQGDLTALIGFLPLIPSALRHIGNATQSVGKYIDESIDLFKQADEFEQMLALFKRRSQPDWIPTGNSRYDALIIYTDNPDYTEWVKRLTNVGHPVKIKNSDAIKDGHEAITVIPYVMEGSIHIRIDPKYTRYIALLHEEVHVNQIVRLLSAGYTQADIRKLDLDEWKVLDGFLESQSYGLELELHKRLTQAGKQGFSDEYVNSIESMITEFWGPPQQLLASSNEQIQKYIDAMSISIDEILNRYN